MPIGKAVSFNRTIEASVGSKATSAAMDKASRTSVGSGNIAATLSTQKPTPVQTAPKATTHPGSKAGLNNAKSVHLNMNDSGYLNRANQTARLKSRTKQIDVSIQNRNVNQKTHNRVNDNRLTSSKTSSISLMSKKSAK